MGRTAVARGLRLTLGLRCRPGLLVSGDRPRLQVLLDLPVNGLSNPRKVTKAILHGQDSHVFRQIAEGPRRLAIGIDLEWVCALRFQEVREMLEEAGQVRVLGVSHGSVPR